MEVICHEESPFIFKATDFGELIGKLGEKNFANVFRELGGFWGGWGLDRFSVAGSHGLICGFGSCYPTLAKPGWGTHFSWWIRIAKKADADPSACVRGRYRSINNRAAGSISVVTTPPNRRPVRDRSEIRKSTSKELRQTEDKDWNELSGPGYVEEGAAPVTVGARAKRYHASQAGPVQSHR